MPDILRTIKCSPHTAQIAPGEEMMTKKQENVPAVDSSTAKGKGEGGHSPHPKVSGETADYEPEHRANVEPPPVKPVGRKKL